MVLLRVPLVSVELMLLLLVPPSVHHAKQDDMHQRLVFTLVAIVNKDPLLA
jgi:hypothetical protein